MGKKTLPTLPAFVVPESRHRHQGRVKNEIKTHQEKKKNDSSLPVLQNKHHRPSKATEMDAFAYCSNYGEKDYKEYRKRFKLKTDDKTGNTRGKYDAEFERKKVKDVIHVITTVLKSKGLETPFLILPFRPNESDGLVKDFLNMIFDDDGSIIEEEKLEKICNIQDELTLITVLKFFWCRLPGNAVIGWRTYTQFVKMEEDANYPPRAFLEFMPSCLSSGAHASIVYDFFDLLVAMVMKSHYNHLSARKLSRLCGLWAFHPVRTHKSSIPSFERGLYEWIPAGDAVFHLFLAFVKAMPPEGRVIRLPKQLQHILKSNMYPPTPTAASDESNTSNYSQELPMVTLRVNYPSENPAEMLSRVSKTLKFDDANLYYTREDYLLLKRLFKDPDMIMKKLSSEGSRILDNVCLYDEDLVSDGNSQNGNKVKYQLLAGWSLDMTAEGGRRRARRSRSGAKMKSSQMPDFFTASVSRVSVDDYFIWTWMASLGPEETNIKKKTFGKTYIMEAQLAEGFKKWVIVEEQDFERDKYDVEIEIKRQKLQALEDQIKAAKEKAVNAALKESNSSMNLNNFTKKVLAEKRAEKMDNSLPPPPPPAKDYKGKGKDAPVKIPPPQVVAGGNGADEEFRRVHMSVLTGSGTEDNTEQFVSPQDLNGNNNNNNNGRYLSRRPPVQVGYPPDPYEKNLPMMNNPQGNYRHPQLLTQHFTPSPPASKLPPTGAPIGHNGEVYGGGNTPYLQESGISESSSPGNGSPSGISSPVSGLRTPQMQQSGDDTSTYYTAGSTVPPIRQGQPRLLPPGSSEVESDGIDGSVEDSMGLRSRSNSSPRPRSNANGHSRSPSPLAGGRSERTSKLIDDIDDLESQIKDLMSEDGDNNTGVQADEQPKSEQVLPDVPYQDRHRSYPNAALPDYPANTGGPDPGNAYQRPVSAQPRMVAPRGEPRHNAGIGQSQLLAPPPRTMPYSSPYSSSDTSFESAKSMPSGRSLMPVRSQSPVRSPSPAERTLPGRPVSSYGFPPTASGLYPRHHHRGQSMAARGYMAPNMAPVAPGAPYYGKNGSHSSISNRCRPISFSSGAPSTYSGPRISPPPASRNYYNFNPSYPAPAPPPGGFLPPSYPNSAYSAPVQGQIPMQQPQYYSQGAPISAQSAPPPTAGIMSQGLIQNMPSGGRINRLHGVRPTNKKQARSALMRGDFGI